MASDPGAAWAATQAALAGTYRLERELGRGGMAIVYQAHDLKHDRPVALKVLRPEIAEAIGGDRFLAEIRTTAQLNHPHIMPLFDSGRAGDALYLVMPLVEGESLRQCIDRNGPLPIADAGRIATEVLSALAFAHRHGVIHRDVKPDNVLLHEGGALVADFGIALVAGAPLQRLTETGVALGTPSYMSPEQALGEREVDARADLYAVGALLYESLTGAPPFESATAQGVLAKVLTEPAAPPSRRRREVPAALDRVVLTALQKDPAARFESGTAMLAALKGADLGPPASAFTRHRRPILVGATAVLLVLVAWLAWPSGRVVHASSIAVLPFANQTRDTANNYLSDGISQDLVDNLSNLRAIEVREWSASLHFRDPGQDLKAVARELHDVDQIVTGRLERFGNTIRVAAQLHDVRTGRPIWAGTYEREATRDLPRLMTGIADSIATVLQLRLASGAATRHVVRDSLAHDLVLRARYLVESRRLNQLRQAIAYFSDAIQRDSTYAAAWAGRATARNMLAAFGGSDPATDFPAAKVDVLHALDLDPDLAEAHATLGFIDTFYDLEWPSALSAFGRAIALDPNQSATWLFRTWALIGANRMDSAIVSIRRAHQLDPRSVIAALRLATVLSMADSMPAAREAYRDAGILDPDNPTIRLEQAQFESLAGRCATADSLVAGVDPGANVQLRTWLRTVDAVCGRRALAQSYLAELEQRARGGEYVDALMVAQLHAVLGDEAGTRIWVQRAIAEHAWSLCLLRDQPAFRAYRGQPWFQAALRELHLL